MIKKLRYWIASAVGISKGEANALLILVPVLLLAIVLPPIFRGYITNHYSNHLADQAILDRLLAQIKNNSQNTTQSITEKLPIVHEVFDPNTATQELLEVNGIPTFIARRIISYRVKGGKFYQKLDLKKIYGLEEDLYESLAPYIKIKRAKKPTTTKTDYTAKRKKFVITPFDINTADTSDFKQIRGIGSKLSFRLVSFRDKLGGFVSTDQLYQVYGLKPDVVDSLLKYGSISVQFLPHQININNDTIRHLSQHPYIDYQLAKAIVNYKRQHGNFTELGQLNKIHLMNDSTYYKILPYLTTE